MSSRPEFRPFPSIENHYQPRPLQDVLEWVHEFPDIQWVAVEKIHGSNAQMVTDGKTVWCGKRHAYLKEDDKFFGFQKWHTKLIPNMLKLFEQIKYQFKETTTIIVYGEVFGGSYPHKDVKKVNDATQVQKNVYYGPDNDFCAFDIFVNEKEKVTFLNHSTSQLYLREYGFLQPRIFKTGSFQECFDLEIESLAPWFPVQFSLPELKDNYVEGIVLKPQTTRNGKYVELFLKKKRKAFMEVTCGHAGKKAPALTLTSLDEKTLEYFKAYITKARVDNIKSQHGQDLHPKRLTGLLLEDAAKEWAKNSTPIDKAVRAKLYSHVQKWCTDLL